MTNPATPTDTTDYQNLIDLLAIIADATNRLDQMQASLQEEHIAMVDERRKDYAALQETITRSSAAIDLLVFAHPEWFSEKRRSIKTPYGTVAIRRSTKLDVPNEEASVLLVEKHCSEEEAAAYLRTEKVLNLEALEKLTDAQLRQFRITRVTDDNLKITPAKIDLGKAVQQAEKEAA